MASALPEDNNAQPWLLVQTGPRHTAQWYGQNCGLLVAERPNLLSLIFRKVDEGKPTLVEPWPTPPPLPIIADPELHEPPMREPFLYLCRPMAPGALTGSVRPALHLLALTTGDYDHLGWIPAGSIDTWPPYVRVICYGVSLLEGEHCIRIAALSDDAKLTTVLMTKTRSGYLETSRIAARAAFMLGLM